MKNDSIEFQTLSREDTGGIQVRHSFRVPVIDAGRVRLEIGKDVYPVFNINAQGVAISLDTRLEFDLGDILKGCRLWLDTELLTDLTATIVHCSATASGRLEYGLHWINLNSSQKKLMDQVLSRMKKRFLEETDQVLPQRTKI